MRVDPNRSYYHTGGISFGAGSLTAEHTCMPWRVHVAYMMNARSRSWITLRTGVSIQFCDLVIPHILLELIIVELNHTH